MESEVTHFPVVVWNGQWRRRGRLGDGRGDLLSHRQRRLSDCFAPLHAPLILAAHSTAAATHVAAHVTSHVAAASDTATAAPVRRATLERRTSQ